MEDIISGETATMSGDNQARMFGKFLSEKHIPVSKALSLLEVKSLAEIKDSKEAFDRVSKAKEEGKL